MTSPLSGLLHRLRARCAHDHIEYCSFHVNGVTLGRVRRDLAGRLRAWPEVFQVTPSNVSLVAALDTPALRTQALTDVVQSLCSAGLVTGWRNEVSAVSPVFGEPPLFHIERAALHFFGLPLHAVQVHGFTGRGADCRMWLARRSAGKPVAPGLLDTLVGGGIGNGLGVRETLLKECWEEAGIGADAASRAVPAGMVRSGRPVRAGWHAEVQFTHDLELPDDFQPVNEDGEVEEFLRLPLPHVLEMMVDSDDLTVEACAAIADFMMRIRFIDPG
jgi:8-oxo-dGTP pyrophosphatase MutT (NUDIX family)